VSELAGQRENNPAGTAVQAAYFLLKEEEKLLVDWTNNTKNCRQSVAVQEDDGAMVDHTVSDVQSFILRYFIFEGRNHVWACRSKCKEAERGVTKGASDGVGASSTPSARAEARTTETDTAASVNQVRSPLGSSKVTCYHCAGNHFKKECPVFLAGKPITAKAKANREEYFRKRSTPAGDESDAGTDVKGAASQQVTDAQNDARTTTQSDVQGAHKPKKDVSFATEVSYGDDAEDGNDEDDDDWKPTINAVRAEGRVVDVTTPHTGTQSSSVNAVKHEPIDASTAKMLNDLIPAMRAKNEKNRQLCTQKIYDLYKRSTSQYVEETNGTEDTGTESDGAGDIGRMHVTKNSDGQVVVERITRSVKAVQVHHTTAEYERETTHERSASERSESGHGASVHTNSGSWGYTEGGRSCTE
jgi:hypothetical protein